MSSDQSNQQAIGGFSDLPLVIMFRLFLRKWWILLLAGIAGGVAGFFYASVQKPKFESRLTFSLDAGATEGALSSAMNLAAQFGLGIGGGQSMFDGDNILEIMKSRRMVESVFLTADTLSGKYQTLLQFYLDNTGLSAAYSRKPHLRNVKFPVGLERASLSYLQDSILYNVYISFVEENLIAARPDKKLGIYEVKVVSFNEQFSKIFTDRLVETTTAFYTEITSKKDRETLEILEQRVASLKGEVGASIESRAGSQDANINPAFAAAQVPALRQQYNMQAYGEAYKEMFKTLEMARYQYLKKIPLLQIIDHADYPMRRIKPGKLRTGLLTSVLAVALAMLAIWVSDISVKRKKGISPDIRA